MEPYYFGASGRRKFGTYHAPAPGTDRRYGAVLCHPSGQEYIRSHRALFHLANRLAAAGIHTMRFDFSGCGDSEGDVGDWSLSTWSDDVIEACEELRSGADLERICLVGLRVGATIAALTAPKVDGADALVLWSPVFDGRHFLDEASREHEAWLSKSFAGRRGNKKELMGFTLTPQFERDLFGVQAAVIPSSEVRRLLIIHPDGDHCAPPVGSLCRRGTVVDTLVVNDPPVWKKPTTGEAGLIPTETLEHVAAWTAASTVTS